MLAGILVLSSALSAQAQVGQWVYKAHMSSPRSGPGVACGHDGKIYVFAGLKPPGGPYLATAEVYDPATDTWTPIKSMFASIIGAEARTLSDGRILVTGYDERSDFNVAQIYDPVTDTYTNAKPFPKGPSVAPELALGNDGNVIGIPSSFGQTSVSRMQAYNVATDTWNQLTNNEDIPSSMGLTSDSAGLVYAVGGSKSGISTGETWTYNDHTHAWLQVASMPTPRSTVSADFGGDGKLYAMGGQSVNGFLTVVEAYDPISNTWAPVAPVPVTFGKLVHDGAGRLYSIGGGDTRDLVICYTPSMMLANGKSISDQEGTAFSGDVATFHDLITGETAANYVANIDWGDGTSTVGIVVPDANADSYIVKGTHTYKTQGPYTTTIKIDDSDGDTTTVKGSASVSNAPINGSALSFSASSGVQFSGVVANFTDDNPFETDADLTATINWGDGSAPATGTVKARNSSGFEVRGTKTFSSPGSFTFKVTVTDGSQNVSFTGTATVAPPPPVVASTTIAVVEGALFSGNVGSFTDADPGLTASSFSATVEWGDGSVTPAFITSNGSGGFNVAGSHTYAKYGAYSIKVNVAVTGGATASATGQAHVSDAPITAKGADLICKGTNFSDTVATFTDGNPFGTAGEFGATIVWGDGKSSTGVVTVSGGSFKVTGAHSYLKKGRFTIQVSIRSTGGSTASATTQVNVGPVK